jgi:hypothetical protein
MDAATVEPKRNMSSYFHFLREQRKLVPVDGAKVLAKRWRALNPGEKVKYVALAQVDKERFLKESDVYEHGEEQAEIPPAKVKKGNAKEAVSKSVNKEGGSVHQQGEEKAEIPLAKAKKGNAKEAVSKSVNKDKEVGRKIR